MKTHDHFKGLGNVMADMCANMWTGRGKVYKILDDGTRELYCECTVEADGITTHFAYDMPLPEGSYRVKWDGPGHIDAQTGKLSYFQDD